MSDTDQPSESEPAPAAGLPKRYWLRPLLACAAVAVGIVVTALLVSLTTDTPAGDAAKAARTVLYEVTASDQTDGGRSVDVTMRIPGGGTSQQSNLQVPLKRKDGTPTDWQVASGTFVYLSAQNQQDAGDITCRITVDGVVLEEVTSSGAYVIATCSGRVP